MIFIKLRDFYKLLILKKNYLPIFLMQPSLLSVIRRPTDSTTSTTNGGTNGQTELWGKREREILRVDRRMERWVLRVDKQVLQVDQPVLRVDKRLLRMGEECYSNQIRSSKVQNMALMFLKIFLFFLRGSTTQSINIG